MTRLNRHLLAIFCIGTLSISSVGSASAETSYADEYVKRIKFARTIQPANPAPFGENINLSTGEVTFTHTDLELKGNGPDITITREFGRVSESSPGTFGGFGTWRFAIPHIVTLTPAISLVDESLGGDWRVETASGPSTNRCTEFSAMWSPPWQYYGPKSGGQEVNEWWRGYQLLIPGEGPEDFISSTPINDLHPPAGIYPAATKTYWQIGCLPGPVTVKGQAQVGEGFLVLSPDGTKYYLDRLVYEPYEMLTTYEPLDYRIWYDQPRSLARMYASKVEDRFGNVVQYGYTGDKLTSITASDGRAVTIEWWSDAPVVKRITSGTQTWNYEYADRTGGDLRLTRVVLPDNSAWELDMGGAGSEPQRVTIYGCMPNLQVNAASSTTVDATSSLRSPTGALGTFAYSWRLHARSYVSSYCDSLDGGQTSYESDNPYYRSLALVDKQVSGPGLPTANWHYDYEAPHASANRNCPNHSCQGTTYTDVTDPNNIVTRYTHSTRVDGREGKLLRIDHALESGVAKRTEAIDYAIPAGAWYVSTEGTPALINPAVRIRTITQAGGVFTWQVPATCGTSSTDLCFDAFARPTKIIKSSVTTP